MRRFAIFALTAAPLFGACKSLPGSLGGYSNEHLVDWKEFDPEAGVLWADGRKRSAAELRKAHPIFLVDVTIIDGTGAPPVPHQDILIEKGRIAEIAKTGEIIPPKGTEKIKAPGVTVMPGLVDTFGFASTGGGPLWEPGRVDELRVLQANLYAGVTTMIVGGDSDKLAELKDQIKKGEVIGPQIFLASPVLTVRNGYMSDLAHGSVLKGLAGGSAAFAREVANPSDAKAKVNALADDPAKFDVIPVMYDVTPAGFPKISQESLRVCIDRAHTRGRKAFVFTGTIEDAAHAVANKANAVVHGVYEETLDAEKAPKLAQLMLVSNVVYIPALVDLWGRGFSVSGQAYPAVALEKETSDSEVLSAFTTVPKNQKGQLFKVATTVGAQVPVAAANLAKLAAWKGEGTARIPLGVASNGAGPGVFPGAALHRELGLMVKAGVDPVLAIAAATGGAARLIREDKADFGVIAAGKRADLLVVDGDVVADIGNTQNVRAVILGGRILDRVPLGKWAERQRGRQAAPAPAAGGKEEPAPKPKKKRSTGADEDPEPIGTP